MTLFLITVLYILAGLYIGARMDEKRMAEPVPYGDLPSGIPLREWRILVYVMSAFGGVPMMAFAIVSAYLEDRRKGFFR